MSDPVFPIAPLDDLPQLSWPEKLAYLAFKFHSLPQVECPLEHSFEDENYIRRIAIPKGTLFVGRVHRLGHVVELLSGSVIHVREHCRKLVQAPFSMTTSPGDQVCAWALTDITARTLHPAGGCSDIEELERVFFESTQSLCEAGEKVDQQLQRRLYEFNRSGGSWSGGDWRHRYSCSRI
jgi:hypothetical protein